MRGFGRQPSRSQRERLIDLERAPTDALLQRHPLEELRGEERATA
jgi:hypothetical protein